MLFSTARGSHTSQCLGWSHTSRRENGAAGKAQALLFPNNPLLPLPRSLSPALRFAARRLWPCHPKGFPAAAATAGNRSVGQFCRGIQHAGCKGRQTRAASGVPSARSRTERAGAAQRWPFWPLRSDVQKAAGWGTSVKVGAGPGISPFSVRSPPAAANGVGRAGTLAPAGGKFPLAGVNEPA